MADFFVISAATRGRVRVGDTVFGLPPDPWEVWTRDNGASVVPVANVNQNDSRGVEVRYTGSGGGTTSGCARYYMAFDTSVITEPVTAVTLWIFKQALGLGNGDFIPVKATAPSTTVNVSGSNYNSIFQYQVGAPMNANGLGNVVDYADNATYGTLDGWNAITLNAAACTDINLLTQFKLALVNYTYDYLYQSPSFGTNDGTAINALSNPPYLEITTGVGQWVLSINPGVTKKVDGVTGTNIKFINRVGAYALYATSPGGVAGAGNPGCSLTFSGTTPLYCVHPVSGLIVGDFVYTNPTMTTPFVGGALWYGIWNVIGDPSWYGNLYQISNTGQITATDIGGCAW